MGCKKLTYQNFSFLEVIHPKKRVSAEKKRLKDYVGNYVYEDNNLKHFSHPEGYVEPDGNGGFNYVYSYVDHLGNVRLNYSDLDGNGSIAQSEILDEKNYYPGGLQHKGYNTVVNGTYHPYGFNGKEENNELDLNTLDFGARNYDPALMRWMNIDPLADQMRRHSPYNYAFDNPLRFVDPDGMAPEDIIGQTRSDARKFKADVHAILADSKFDNLRGLITTSGKKFDKIDAGALSTALDGVTLSTDEQAYVDALTSTINSNETHTVEFASETGNISTDGKDAVVAHLNNTQAGVGNMMLKPDGTLSASVVKGLGGAGFNVPDGNGSHSIILEGSGITHSGGNRAVTSGHEVIGHGVPSARGLTPAQNNTNAIRTDNLIRRILGIPTRTGANHAGGKQGQITNPNALPITN